MTNSIDKVRAANLLLNAICKELGDDAPIFKEHYDQHSNPVAAVISAYENFLDYRERAILGMKLGFDHGITGVAEYGECKRRTFFECGITFELVCAESASRIFHKALCKLAYQLMVTTE